MITRSWYVAILSMFIVALCGCGKESSKPAKPAIQKQAEKVQKTEAAKGAAPAVKTEETKVETEMYLYEPRGRRDPFLSIIEASKKEKEAEKKKKGLRPSETFDVSELKVIAIASEKNHNFAMVQFPDNKYATVKEGMTLGLYGGKVVRIDKEGVVIREYVKNYRGEIQPKDTILRLRKEEGE